MSATAKHAVQSLSLFVNIACIVVLSVSSVDFSHPYLALYWTDFKKSSGSAMN